MATAAFSAGMVQWAAINVAIARKKYGIKYPKMYEGTDDSVFDCVQRAHQNTLEYLPSFLSLLMLNGIAAPYSTAVVGMVLSCSFVLVLHSRASGPGQAATGGDMEECRRSGMLRGSSTSWATGETCYAEAKRALRMW
jgi:uncharacterized membrane protein YecN with MAPEG domain